MRRLLTLLFCLLSLEATPLEEALKELVAIQSITSDLQKNKDAFAFVKEQLKGLPLYYREKSYNGHPTLFITTKDTEAPDILLAAHIDVVPASASLFMPHSDNGKLYGRGVYDMKMAIACYIRLLHDLPPPLSQYDLGILLTSDEEVGGVNGTGAVLAEGIRSKVALLPDGGFNWNFEEEAKGVLHLKLTAKGQTAHSSRPWEGKNAILLLSKGLQAIDAYFDKKKCDNGYFTTANPGTIEGGQAVNQVAGSAEAKIDIRFTPSTDAETLLKEVQEVVKPFDGLQVEKIISASPSRVDLSLPYYKTFSRIAKERFNIDIGKTRAHGASDARYFGEKGIPVLVIAPLGGDIHSEGEWIDLEDLERFYVVMKEWVIETLTSGKGKR